MKLAIYFPDEKEFKSESGLSYACNLKSNTHFLIPVALSRLLEGNISLQECYDSISTNYILDLVNYELGDS